MRSNWRLSYGKPQVIWKFTAGIRQDVVSLKVRKHCTSIDLRTPLGTQRATLKALKNEFSLDV
jgi:hypothetical protein